MNATAIMILAEIAWAGCGEVFALWSRRRSAGADPAADDPAAEYEAAYLGGGARRVVQTALVGLHADGRIAISRTGGRLRRLDEAPRDAVEAAVLEKIGSSSRPVPSLIRAVAATPAVEDVRRSVIAKGRFVPGSSSRAAALIGPAGSLLLAAASVPVALAKGGPLPWSPAAVGLVLIVASARLPAGRPTLRGRLLLRRLRRAGSAGGDVGRVALHGASALEEDDSRRAFFPPAPHRSRLSPKPRAWDPDLGGSDFIDRWLLRDLRSLLRAANHGGYYGIEGISAFWSDGDGGRHHAGHSGGGHHGGFDSGGDHGGFDAGGHHGW